MLKTILWSLFVAIVVGMAPSAVCAQWPGGANFGPGRRPALPPVNGPVFPGGGMNLPPGVGFPAQRTQNHGFQPPWGVVPDDLGWPGKPRLPGERGIPGMPKFPLDLQIPGNPDFRLKPLQDRDDAPRRSLPAQIHGIDIDKTLEEARRMTIDPKQLMKLHDADAMAKDFLKEYPRKIDLSGWRGSWWKDFWFVVPLIIVSLAGGWGAKKTLT
jgi:hypothetical protein